MGEKKSVFEIRTCKSYLKDLLLVVILYDQGHLPDRE